MLTVEFLGCHVRVDGIRPSEERVEVITQFPKAKAVSDLCRLLGILNFKRHSLPRASITLLPLNECLKRDTEYDERVCNLNVRIGIRLC